MMRMLIIKSLFVLTCTINTCAFAYTNRPIIGVFAQPISNRSEYIAASYVKWLESAGARVIPIPYEAPFPKLKSLFHQINGILFPGGDAKITPSAQYVYDLAVKANKQGDFFPVWGTCLGFEWLLQMTSKRKNVLDQGLDAWNMSVPLHFTPQVKTSKLFQSAPQQLVSALAEQPITLNNHEGGIHPDHFAADPLLTAFYNILATNKDRHQVPFVSVMESKQFPIYGVQFHPEKNLFEWGTYRNGVPYEAINHDFQSIVAAQYFANFFVHEARKNSHKFDNPTLENSLLIYHYTTNQIQWPEFTQTYVFKDENKPQFWNNEIETKM